MATKGGREKIKLESTAGTGHFYTTTKNKKTMPEKMSIMKLIRRLASTSNTRKSSCVNPAFSLYPRSPLQWAFLRLYASPGAEKTAPGVP